MKTMIGFLLLLTLLAAGTSFAMAQDAPPQINLALADLSERLGANIQLQNLETWNFSETRYTDTAFGCPFVAGEARPEGILAYTFLLTYQGTTYEYRVALDNSIVFPCDQTLLNATPVIAPEVTVTACPADFSGFLPSRLDINARAQVVSQATPLRLRRAPNTNAEQITLLNQGTIVEVVGGPSCDSGFVWWQIAASGQVGWAAEGQLPDLYFLGPVGSDETPTPAATATSGALLATPTLPPTVTPSGGDAQATPLNLQPVGTPADETTAGVTTTGQPELAGVRDGEVLLFDLTDTGLVALGAMFTAGSEFGPGVSHIEWSPMGDFVAFTVIGENNVHTLYVVNVQTTPEGELIVGEPVEWTSDVYPFMPVTFTQDGQNIVYTKRGEGEPTEQGEQVNVFVHPLNLDATGNLVGTFNFGIGCGGGSPFPGDTVYNSEAGYGGRGLVFDLTQFGIVYSTNCTGSGLALMNLENGQSVDLGQSLSRARVNAAGTQVVAIDDAEPQGTVISGTLTVVDLSTGAVTPLGAVAAPDQVAWGPEGEVFYSTRQQNGVIPGSDTQAFVDMGFSEGVPMWRVAIHRVDLDAATDAEIATMDAYAVGRMFASPDGTTLYVSTIGNGESWVEGLNNSTITVETPPVEVMAPFGPALHSIDLSTGTVTALASQVYLGALNPAAPTPIEG